VTSAASPQSAFSFAVLGDAPYFPWEELKYRVVLREITAADLAWVTHIGDIFWRPCTDDRYVSIRDRLHALPHPVIFTPGDNEWTDCWEKESGGFAPLERLALLRRTFYPRPTRSLGTRALTVATQASDPKWKEFVEHTRWEHDGVIGAAVHLVGSWNGRAKYPGYTAAQDREVTRRTEAATAWVRATFARARAVAARAVFIALHANPGFERPKSAMRQTFEPFATALQEEAARFPRPILIAHGDYHDFVVDHPLTDLGTGKSLSHVTRLQVPGSPEVGWVHVTVARRSGNPFDFKARLVPWWRF
jgi:hypothetical protein